MSEIPIPLNLPDKAPTITSKLKTIFEKHLTLEGRYKQYLVKYEKVHGALPRDQQEKIEQVIADKLYKKAKLSFIRDAVIVVAAVCGGVFLYKNGAVIADGMQNMRENNEPFEKRSAESWAEFFKQKGQLNLWGELPPGEHKIGGNTLVGGNQGYMPLTNHPVKELVERFPKFVGQTGGITGKIYESGNSRVDPNSAVFAAFSTLEKKGEGVRERWRQSKKTMALRYHTKWNAKNILDDRGPICRYDLLAFVPRKEGKQFIRQAVEDPGLFEDVFGKLCAGIEKTTTRIPTDRVAIYEGGPVWGFGRLIGNVLKLVKPLDRFFGTPDLQVR